MPVILYGVGALTFAIGIVAIGFGIPNKEFGLGNTLIVAGMIAAVGGLIVGALGVVVAQLRRVAEALSTRTPVRTSRQFEPFEAAAQPQAGPARLPFPPRPKAEPKGEAKPEIRPEAEPAPRHQFVPEPRMDMPFAPPPPPSFKEQATDYFAPHLPNPDEPPVTIADEAHLSPLHPAAPPPPPLSPPPPPFFRVSKPAVDRDEATARRPEPSAHRDEPTADSETHVPPPPPPRSFFDTMWPAEPRASEPRVQEAASQEPKVEEPSASEPPPAPKPAAPKPAELPWPRRSEPAFGKASQPAEPPASDETREAITGRHPGEAAETPEGEEPRAVAILKSGVVDGMGYTLYVDGSIEAELPQGTLRFASINELRSHLEKTS